MLKKTKLKIKWKILSIFLILVVIAIGATNILWIYSMDKDLRERIIQNQEGIATNAHISVDEFMNIKVRNLIIHSQTNAFVEKDIQGARRELLILLNQDSDIREVSFIDINGHELIKATPEKIFPETDLINQSLNPKFIIPTFRHGTEFLGDVYYSKEDIPIITIAIPIVVPITRYHLEEITTARKGVFQRNPGEILGVLSAEVSLQGIRRVSENFNVGEGGYMYIVDKNNRLIIHPDERIIEERKDFSNVGIIREHQFLDKGLMNDTGGHPYVHVFTGEFLSEKNEKVLATFHHIPVLDWGLVVQQPENEVFEPTRTVARFAGILFGGGILATVILAFWFSSIITRPIGLLGKGVRTIAKGNYDYKIDIRTNDELQDLAGSFNEMAASVKRAIEKEKYLEAIKRDFVSVAAHQLRTPLSSIKWAIAILAEKAGANLTNEQKVLLQKTALSNEKMIELVDDLLNVAKIEDGKFVYNNERVDMIGLVKKVAGGIRERSPGINIKVGTRAVHSEDALEVFGDKEKLGLAVTNLIENAIRYTVSEAEVAVSIQKLTNRVKISVKDSGIGIPKDQQALLFSKFFRGRNAIKHQTSGSGLGLFIVKNVVGAHGGTIEFQSEENKGSTFSIILPTAHEKS